VGCEGGTAKGKVSKGALIRHGHRPRKSASRGDTIKPQGYNAPRGVAPQEPGEKTIQNRDKSGVKPVKVGVNQVPQKSLSKGRKGRERFFDMGNFRRKQLVEL